MSKFVDQNIVAKRKMGHPDEVFLRFHFLGSYYVSPVIITTVISSAIYYKSVKFLETKKLTNI